MTIIGRSLWLAVLLPLALAACGDTWQGVKEDTGENMKAAGSAMEEAGEDVEDSAQ